MIYKSEAQAFFNQLPPSRRKEQPVINPIKQRDAEQIRERRKRIDEIQDALRLERQFRINQTPDSKKPSEEGFSPPGTTPADTTTPRSGAVGTTRYCETEITT